jgi:hypothetical protein
MSLVVGTLIRLLVRGLLTERQMRVAEEGSSRPRGLWRLFRPVRRSPPTPTASSSSFQEQEKLEWTLSDVRYCLAMGMAGKSLGPFCMDSKLAQSLSPLTSVSACEGEMPVDTFL